MKKSKLEKKTILFWINGRMPTDAQLEASFELAKEAGARVLFRNARAFQDGETPEAVHGVAGAATPDAYRNDDFKFYKVAAPTGPSKAENAPEGLGLPEGHPTTRKELVEALAAKEVGHAGNAKTETLVSLYREKVLNEG